MPAESQSQARLMNWVHAVQKGEAKGSGKVNEIAKEMKPSDTEHFMNRGHIDKSLPEHVKSSEFRDYLRAIKRKKEVNPIFSRDIDPYTSEDVYNFRDIASEAETYKERLHAHKDASKLKQPGISITTQRTTPRAQEMASKAIEELKANFPEVYVTTN